MIPENILYKAKRYDNGEWVFGSFLRLDYHNSSDYVESNQIILLNGHSYEIDPKTLCAFTGMHDKNMIGEMVFQNDILRTEVNKKRWVVKWHDLQWRVYAFGEEGKESYGLFEYYRMMMRAATYFDVVGNTNDTLS